MDEASVGPDVGPHDTLGAREVDTRPGGNRWTPASANARAVGEPSKTRRGDGSSTERIRERVSLGRQRGAAPGHKGRKAGWGVHATRRGPRTKEEVGIDSSGEEGDTSNGTSREGTETSPRRVDTDSVPTSITRPTASVWAMWRRPVSSQKPGSTTKKAVPAVRHPAGGENTEPGDGAPEQPRAASDALLSSALRRSVSSRALKGAEVSKAADAAQCAEELGAHTRDDRGGRGRTPSPRSDAGRGEGARGASVHPGSGGRGSDARHHEEPRTQGPGRDSADKGKKLGSRETEKQKRTES